MNRSENFVAAMVACAVFVAALGLMKPRLVVLNSERGVGREHGRGEGFSLRCVVGGRVFAVDYLPRDVE